MSESVCSQNEIGERKLFSESSNETFAEEIPASLLSVCCSGSDESKSTELRSVDSFHVHGDVPRHSDAV